MNVVLSGRALRILDFDVECRPLSWYGGDWVTKEITSIAWKFVGERARTQVRTLSLWDAILPGDSKTAEEMLTDFCAAYDEADMVTGHFIRGFDLPVIQGALIEHNLPLLGQKLTHCTKGDLLKFQGLSKSQENLGAMLGTKAPKVSMDQMKWRKANRLTAEGIEKTRKRVVGDVKQHIQMRELMLDRQMLSGPRVWRPSAAAATVKYAP